MNILFFCLRGGEKSSHNPLIRDSLEGEPNRIRRRHSWADLLLEQEDWGFDESASLLWGRTADIIAYLLKNFLYSAPPQEVHILGTPRNHLLDISPGCIQVVEYTLSPHSATLLKARILFYIIKHYRKYVQYIYIFTHDCRQISERPELKEFFASAGLMLPLSPFLLVHDEKKKKRCHYANFDWFRIFEMGNDKWQL